MSTVDVVRTIKQVHPYGCDLRKNKIDGIYEYLLNDINDEDLQRKINEIEEILYEGRWI